MADAVDQGIAPSNDGDINTYLSGEAVESGRFRRDQPVIFVNGMLNSPDDHRLSALALSLLQMAPVVGVYNRSSGALTDLGQCIADKYQFHGPLARNPKEALDKVLAQSASRPGPPLTRAAAMEGALERNAAALALFRLLRQPAHRRTPIFAHSQGNLILSNVLMAIAAVDGDGALTNRSVYTFGSPAMNWPQGIQPIECGFTFDPVTWLAGFDTSFRISKLGLPSGSLNPITHSFLEYLRHDAAFVVNRFRWGSFGVTASMNEEGLAQCLFEMEGNLSRVTKVFEHLDKKHNSDADDVAVLYVGLLKQPTTSKSLVDAVRRDSQLKNLLIRVMDEGWTSAEESEAISFLKG